MSEQDEGPVTIAMAGVAGAAGGSCQPPEPEPGSSDGEEEGVS